MQLNEPVKRAQREHSLSYLAIAEKMVDDFLAHFKESLPAQLSFSSFSEIVTNLCMNSTQLRMNITNTAEAKTSQNLVTSQVSTIIISYLDMKEQIHKA